MSFKEFLRQKRAPVYGDYYIPKGSENPTDHKYTEIAKQGYEYNAYERAAIDLATNEAASLTPVLYEYDSSGEKREVKDSEINKLLMFPNPDEGSFGFKQRMFGYYSLADKCYIQKVTIGGEKRPRALNLWQPDTVEVLSGGVTRPIGGYRLQVAGKGKVTFNPDEVIYIRGFHPLNITDGSPTSFASGYAIDTNNAMMKYNLRNMQNGGTPPLVIKGARTQREVNQLSDAWDKEYGGAENAGKPFFPMSGVEIDTLGMNNAEAQWVEGIELTGKQIMIARLVPPELLLGTSNRASYEQAYKALYIQVVLPMWQAFLDSFNNSLCPLYADRGRTLMLEIDKNKIDALSEDKNELHKRVRQDYLAGIATRKEAREVVGYDPDESGIDGEAFQRPVNVTVVPQDGEEVDMGGEMEDITGNNVNDADPNPDDDAIADR